MAGRGAVMAKEGGALVPLAVVTVTLKCRGRRWQRW